MPEKAPQRNSRDYRVLLTYASHTGITGEIGAEIARCLIEAGYTVDIHPIREVKVILGYNAIVLGTSIRREKPLPEAIDFVRQNRAILRHIPIAVFSVGAGMRIDTPENREITLKYLKPLLQEINEPVTIGMLAGKLDTGELSMWWRMMVPRDGNGPVPDGDWRDWDKIRAWAMEVAAKLAETT